ncbi:double-strand break repair protein AddB [Roseivivax sediminis]|uniref:Double-strand break repair protein AddB n=1 Tax=Roseivivax sediminis TaxID=936889 RepID=A0A1I1UBE3_9RHOB|nr:double-strand break repair protein AddB [Roseivivax sediminis]SFD68181.1 double-strand break repair protein AddB [Roseivivax sediminis]
MIFPPEDGPRIFALAPGVDFPRAVVDGLRARYAGTPPEAIARAEVIVNTQRMKRRIEAIFAEGPAGFLPRITRLDSPGDPAVAATLAPAVPPLRRRLELTALVSRLLDAEPDLAPRAALFDLADSLAALMEEMQIEGVAPETISGLDVSDQSGHWARSLRFVEIVQHYFDVSSPADPAALQARIADARIAAWQAAPPEHPVIVAGSTGSRGTTLRLMAAVARLPQGALILPGFDGDLPRHVWDQLTDAMPRADHTQPGEDHPQFRFSRLFERLGLSPQDVRPWTDAAPPAPARNRLVSLALRPAPVTDQWLSEGPTLGDLGAATEGMTLVEAPTRRDEAQAIALRLRAAAEDGEDAALVTPDRMLTRQVSAALGRWGIVPDDSAGVPGQLTPPGRLLRHAAQLCAAPLSAEALITVLKHPLAHAGDPADHHGLLRQRLELFLRGERLGRGLVQQSIPYPEAAHLRAFGTAFGAEAWAEWVIATFCQPPVEGRHPLPGWVEAHIARTEAIVAGPAGDPAPLWDKEAGRAVREAMEALRAEAEHGADLSARDYAALVDAVLRRVEVRQSDTVHPHIRIWGTLEARVTGGDLLILGALNDGTWPEMPQPDPWLNRRMRADAGLLLPERRIGLSAHDFQQAVAGQEVWLTRSKKSDDAETVPSRWLNRLTNLMTGLDAQGGKAALTAMRARGDHWLGLASALEAPIEAAPAPRPAPVPPVDVRPRQLSVTRIKTLIRDPYAIYAAHVLNLRPLGPLQRAPDALLRGIVLHAVLDAYVRGTLEDPVTLSPDALMEAVRRGLAELPFPTIRQLWEARMGRVAPGFVTEEAVRQARAAPHPERLEIGGKVDLPATGFRLTGTADRIDIDDRGGAWIYDYKTGPVPSSERERYFDKQLLLEAGMALRGGFPNLAPRHIAGLAYIGLSSDAGEKPLDLDVAPPDEVWAEFERLIAGMLEEDHGFTARRAMQEDAAASDYDHLSRLGEWEVTDPAAKERLA